jgi:hypothetical protein
MTEKQLNTAVFTTKYIIDNLSPVLYVYHENDGCWQFHGEDDVTEEDARLVSLGEMLEIDKSLAEILNMPEGYEAIRTNKTEKWQIRKTTTL